MALPEITEIWFATLIVALFYAKFNDWRVSLIWSLLAVHLNSMLWWFSVFLLIGFALVDLIPGVKVAE